MRKAAFAAGLAAAASETKPLTPPPHPRKQNANNAKSPDIAVSPSASSSSSSSSTVSNVYTGPWSSATDQTWIIPRFPLHNNKAKTRPTVFVDQYDTSKKQYTIRAQLTERESKHRKDSVGLVQPQTEQRDVRSDIVVTKTNDKTNELTMSGIVETDSKHNPTEEKLIIYHFLPKPKTSSQSDSLPFCQTMRALELQWSLEQQGQIGSSSLKVIAFEWLRVVPIGDTWSWELNLNLLRWIYAGFRVECVQKPTTTQLEHSRKTSYGQPYRVTLCKTVPPPSLESTSQHCSTIRPLGPPTFQLSQFFEIHYTNKATELWKDYVNRNTHYNIITKVRFPSQQQKTGGGVLTAGKREHITPRYDDESSECYKEKEGTLTREEMGYVRAPRSKSEFAPPGTGIRCGMCVYLKDVEDATQLGTCSLMKSADNTVHTQGCCNLWDSVTHPAGLLSYHFASSKEIQQKMSKKQQKEGEKECTPSTGGKNDRMTTVSLSTDEKKTKQNQVDLDVVWLTRLNFPDNKEIEIQIPNRNPNLNPLHVERPASRVCISRLDDLAVSLRLFPRYVNSALIFAHPELTTGQIAMTAVWSVPLTTVEQIPSLHPQTAQPQQEPLLKVIQFVRYACVTKPDAVFVLHMVDMVEKLLLHECRLFHSPITDVKHKEFCLRFHVTHENITQLLALKGYKKFITLDPDWKDISCVEKCIPFS